MRQTRAGLAAQPAHDRDSVVTKDHQRIVRVANDTSQLRLQDLIQKLHRGRLVKSFLRHILLRFVTLVRILTTGNSARHPSSETPTYRERSFDNPAGPSP